MVCFIDISQKILYDSTKAESEMLSLINSTISHEMRNPLNSIINNCRIQKIVCQQFKSLLQVYGKKFDEVAAKQLSHIQTQMSKGNLIQTSSSSLLLLNVEDILGFAQIKAGKFVKVLKRFNLKKAIQDIQSI